MRRLSVVASTEKAKKPTSFFINNGMLFNQLCALLFEQLDPKIELASDLLQDMHMPVSKFINNYKYILPKKVLDKLPPPPQIPPDVDKNSDEYIDWDIDVLQPYEDKLVSLIAKHVNDITIKHFNAVIDIGFDGGQGEGAYVVLTPRTLKPEETAEVLQGGKFFHITKEANIQNIKTRGLVPQSARDISINYPPAIFLFKNLPDEEELREFGVTIQGKPGVSLLGMPESLYQGKLALFEVNLPKTYKLMQDPHYHKGYYTNKAIPSKFVKFIKIF